MTDQAPENPDRDGRPSGAARLAGAASRGGLGALTPGEAPTGEALFTAIGGVRGLVESLLPGLAFLVVFTITQDVVPSVLAPLAISIVFVVVRLVTRTPVVPALAGVLGIGISAGVALLSGRPEDNFVPGLIVNVVWLVGMLVTLAIRRPAVGFLVGLLRGDATGWLRDARVRRAMMVATALWAAMFALRLGVQAPLWAAGAVTALGTAKLVMGVPLYAAVLWVTWLIARAAGAPRSTDADDRVS